MQNESCPATRRTNIDSKEESKRKKSAEIVLILEARKTGSLYWRLSTTQTKHCVQSRNIAILRGLKWRFHQMGFNGDIRRWIESALYALHCFEDVSNDGECDDT
jgi:hypothetical protein